MGEAGIGVDAFVVSLVCVKLGISGDVRDEDAAATIYAGRSVVLDELIGYGMDNEV